jgi:hypothetical protein
MTVFDRSVPSKTHSTTTRYCKYFQLTAALVLVGGDEEDSGCAATLGFEVKHPF